MPKPKSKPKTANSAFSLVHQRNRDNFKLLASHKKFQHIVSETRKQLKIPHDGFKDRITYSKWCKKLFSLNIDRQWKRIQKNLERGEISAAMAEKQLRLLYGSNKELICILNKNVKLIIDNFNLPLNYGYYIRRYILFNQITAPMQNFTVFANANLNQLPQKRRTVQIKIFSRLTNADLKEIKRQVNNVFGKNLRKFGVLGNIDTKLKIEEWYEDRARYDTVEGKDYKISAKEISENILGDEKKFQHVYDAPRKLEKLRKKRFGK